MSILNCKNLRKVYGKRDVVKNVSFEISNGESVAILGPNGAGKTTCFYMISGIVKPTSGDVFLNGNTIAGLPMHIRARLGIGYLPQEASIFTGLSVEQNILCATQLFSKSKDESFEILEKLLLEFKISHLRKQNATSLSGGERRRLEIARCLAINPNFILLDEPFAGVDPVSVADVRYIVSHLKDRGIGVIVTDHNVRETLKMVDRAYIIFEGSVLTHGEPDEVVSNKDVREYYLGHDW